MSDFLTSEGNRWKQIARSIQEAIENGSLPPGTRLPSETVLAQEHDVCRMTAHRAMHELQRLGLVTRQRRHGTIVASHTPRQTGNVAVLTFVADDFPSADFLRGLRAGLPPDARLLLCDTGEDAAREAQFLQQMRREADAIALFPSAAPQNTPLLRQILASGMPLICLDRVPDDLEVDAVITDNFGSSLEAMRRLTTRGHRHITHFTDHRLVVSSTRERYQAFLQALNEIGVPQPESAVRLFTAFAVERDGYYQALSQAVHDALFTLLHADQPPTAIFCLQDNYLAAVLEACRTLKVAVPGDLEIVSFNDCPPGLAPLPCPIIRIVQQPFEMGRIAGQRLVRRLEGEVFAPEIVRVSALIHEDDATQTIQPDGAPSPAFSN